MELRNLIPNINNFFLSKRSLKKNEVNAILRSLRQNLDLYYYDAQLALLDYDTKLGKGIREQGYPEGWWDLQIMAEMIVELYERQLGLDGDTGELIKLGDFLERHHIDYDKSKSDLIVLILLSQGSHKDIDHRLMNLDHYTRLRSARDAFEQGLPPPHWNKRAQERYFKIQEKIKVKGIENALFGGMTKQEMINFLTMNFLNRKIY